MNSEAAGDGKNNATTSTSKEPQTQNVDKMAVVSAADVTGQKQLLNTIKVEKVAEVQVVQHPQGGAEAANAADAEGLLQLEPPLSGSDYSFSLDDQENLNDLFALF